MDTWNELRLRKNLSQMSQLVIFGAHHHPHGGSKCPAFSKQRTVGRRVSKADLGLRYQLLTEFKGSRFWWTVDRIHVPHLNDKIYSVLKIKDK